MLIWVNTFAEESSFLYAVIGNDESAGREILHGIPFALSLFLATCCGHFVEADPSAIITFPLSIDRS